MGVCQPDGVEIPDPVLLIIVGLSRVVPAPADWRCDTLSDYIRPISLIGGMRLFDPFPSPAYIRCFRSGR